jgi:sugar phosphate isomerase/epimerase
MRVGVFTPLLSKLPLEAVLKKLAELNIQIVELATGNYVGDAHCKLSMLGNSSALSDFKKILSDHGASISALSCHGNALHPNKSVGQSHRETSRNTILLAEKLGVPVMVDFSGCPGILPTPLRPIGLPAPGLRTFAPSLTGSGTRWSRRIGSSTRSLRPTTG